MMKMRRRFIEQKQGQSEPPNASLLVVLACSIDAAYLTSLSHEIRSSPSLNSSVYLLRSIDSLPLTDLPAFAFGVESQVTGELLA